MRHAHTPDTTEEEQQQRLVLATGGVDKFLTIYTVAREQPQGASSSASSCTGFGPPVQAAVLTGFPGPLLSLDIAPRTVEVLVPALSAASTAAAAGVGFGRVCVCVVGS